MGIGGCEQGYAPITMNPTSEKEKTMNPTTKKSTTNPTKNPTANPTGNPTANPTDKPTGNPTANPTINPTGNPTASPIEKCSTYNHFNCKMILSKSVKERNKMCKKLIPGTGTLTDAQNDGYKLCRKFFTAEAKKCNIL